jgi:thiamine kinase-like enzyme
MTFSVAPLDLDEVLSPAWLEPALGGACRGARVAATTVVETLTTIASKVRFRVDYVDGAVTPAALCVKGYFAPESRRMVSVGQVEARFYRDLAPLICGTYELRVPPCVYAGIDDESGHGLVVMSDLVAAGARFLTALSPYTVDQAAATLEQLARLHAVDVQAPAIRDMQWLDPRLGGYLDYVTPERLQQQLDDGRAADIAPEYRDAARLRAALSVLAERAVSHPQVLIHGDAHAGNLYLTAEGEPGLIDWQVLQRGPWELDVAYHVAAVLDGADRERSEQALLAHYLDARRAIAGDAPAWGQAWDDYRAAFAYGYFMWAITQRVERPIVETFVTRLGTAAQHHGSFERLGV